ncbi:MAG: LysM repeat protein [Lentimonas sp.]|jgi:LysM repeat protein
MRHTRRQFNRTALLAAAGCTSLAQQVFAQATATSYTVKNGDTLGHIALRHGVSESSLKQANNLSSDLIKVGQELDIPNANSPTAAASADYTVNRGDTLGGIALAHSISTRQLRRANAIKGDLIRVGQTLKIPPATLAATGSNSDLIQEVRRRTEKIAVRTGNWDTIIVHHSAIKYGNAEIYDKAHRRRGMQNGLAYHFIIGNGIDSGNGEIEIGPRWEQQLLGGHVKSYSVNLTAIGICLVGNFETTHPSRRQLDALTQLLDWLQDDVLRKKTRFAGHKDIPGEQTVCPGKNFPLTAMHARYD